MVDIIKEGPFPVVAYSNFLERGLYPIAKLLDQYNISYKMITGNTTHDKLVKTVNDYNDGKIKVLLLSAAGSESLDLKNTRQVHISEPHWHDERINQVIGRAIRYKSHIALPPNDRNVTVYKWVSVFNKAKIHNMSADEYLIEVSNKKRKLFDTFKELIIESSIEMAETNKNVMTRMRKQHKKEYQKYAKMYNDMRKK